MITERMWNEGRVNGKFVALLYRQGFPEKKLLCLIEGGSPETMKLTVPITGNGHLIESILAEHNRMYVKKPKEVCDLLQVRHEVSNTKTLGSNFRADENSDETSFEIASTLGLWNTVRTEQIDGQDLGGFGKRLKIEMNLVLEPASSDLFIV